MDEEIACGRNKKENEDVTTPGDSMEAMDSDIDRNDDPPQCPLFMGTDGLPSNFASNNALAAIASLLNDDDDGDASTCSAGEISSKAKTKSLTSKVTPKQGGGKVSRRIANRNRAMEKRNPYNKPVNDKPKATMGEAQLFLKMWKI